MPWFIRDVHDSDKKNTVARALCLETHIKCEITYILVYSCDVILRIYANFIR